MAYGIEIFGANWMKDSSTTIVVECLDSAASICMGLVNEKIKFVIEENIDGECFPTSFEEIMGRLTGRNEEDWDRIRNQ
jgi:hypothetical protein